MPAPLKIIAGDRFGRLTVIREVERYKKKRYFQCRCDCGQEGRYRLVSMRAGEIKSCGCLRDEQNRTASLTHGLSGTPLYNSWHSMKQRCLNHNLTYYKWYGGRGITICADWMDFEPFRDWALANGYGEHLTIERIDVDGNYEPDNCCWIPKSQQSCNTRRTRLVTHLGQTKPIKHWAIELGLHPQTVYKRLRRGLSPKEALGID